MSTPGVNVDSVSELKVQQDPKVKPLRDLTVKAEKVVEKKRKPNPKEIFKGFKGDQPPPKPKPQKKPISL